ncbi:hypothetical protein EBS67_12440 [bacterium]|nr:GxxExxY protein [Gemmataceae bacterium]NBS90786.1 hypothetical protein [bacterium]NBT61916.1 hypothetical protein [Planctomycetia bacterium]
MIGASIEVFRGLGCGFLERVYQQAMSVLGSDSVFFPCLIPCNSVAKCFLFCFLHFRG